MRYYRAAVIALLFIFPVISILTVTLNADTKKASIPFEKLIPSDTLLYVSLVDVKILKKELGRCALGRLWKNKNIRRALAPFFETLNGIVDQMDCALDEAGLALTIDEFAAAFDGRISFAITGFASKDSPIFAAQADVSENFKKIIAAVRVSLNNLKSESKGKVAVTETELNGQPHFKVVTEGEDLPLHVGFTEGCCYLSNHEQTFLDLISAAGSGGRGNPLVANIDFNIVRGEVLPEGSDIFLFYCDMQQIKKLILSAPGDDAARASTAAVASFLDGVKAIGWGTFSSRGLLKERFYIHKGHEKLKPPDKKNAVKHEAGKYVTFDSSRLVPDRAIFFGVTASSPKNIVETLVEYANKVEPQTRALIDDLLEKAGAELGFNPLVDFAGSLQGESALFIVPPEAGPLPNFGMVASVADMKKYEKCMKKLLDYSDRHPVNNRALISQIGFGNGGTIFSVSDQIDMGLPYLPSWAVIDNSLLIASTPQLVKKIATQKNEESLSGSRSFGGIKSQCLDNSSMAVYVDVSSFVRIFYSLAVPMFRDQLPPGFRLSLLPTPEEVSAYFLPATFSLAKREAGFLVQTTSNFCPLPAFLPMLATVAAPDRISAEKASNEAVAIYSLRSILVGQEIYRNKNKEYAASLRALIRSGLVEDQLKGGYIQGYSLRMSVDGNGTSFELYATPLQPGATGDNYFYINSKDGIIRAEYSPDVGPDSPPFYDDK